MFISEMKVFPVLPEFRFLDHLFQKFRFCDQCKSEEKRFGGWGVRGVSNIGILHTKLKSFKFHGQLCTFHIFFLFIRLTYKTNLYKKSHSEF